MFKFWENHIKKGSLKDLIVHLIPAVIATFLFQVISIEIYHHNPLTESKMNFFIWVVSQAFGSYFLGSASDKFCRKKTLIVTQACGILAMFYLMWAGCSDWLAILFTGLTFSPSAIAKAALIDNFPRESKVRMIGITFIALFLPWCFFSYIVSLDPLYVLIPSVSWLIINLFLTIFYFEDRRDKASHHKESRKFFNKKRKAKAFLTSLALLPGQMIFFLSDSYFEESVKNAPFFTLLGIGVLIGAIVSVFYKKTPHLSMVSICYGMGFIFCAYSLIATKFILLPDTVLPVIIMLFSILGGFYLPFVYDAILSSVSSNYRGTACGIIEVIISLAALAGLGTILIFGPSEWTILFLMTILFLAAFIIQRSGEKHEV